MKLFNFPPFYQLTLHLGVLSSDLDAGLPRHEHDHDKLLSLQE